MRYGRTELYRLYEDGDWTGSLLYIGISHNYWKLRRLDHRRAYGTKVSDQPRIVVFDSRQEAEIAEAMAQFHECPRDGKYAKTEHDLSWIVQKIRHRYLENIADSDPMSSHSTYVLAEMLAVHQQNVDAE